MTIWKQLAVIFRALEAKAKGEKEYPEIDKAVDLRFTKEWYLGWIDRLWEIISAAATATVAQIEERLTKAIAKVDSDLKQEFTAFKRTFTMDDIARALVDNPGFVQALDAALRDYEQNARKTSEEDKRQSIREIVAQLKGYADPSKVSDELIASLYEARILYRAQRKDWARLIEQELLNREKKVTESILSMVGKANQKKVEVAIEPLAKTLVLLAVSPDDQESFLAALYEEDDEQSVVPYLLKSYRREVAK